MVKLPAYKKLYDLPLLRDVCSFEYALALPSCLVVDASDHLFVNIDHEIEVHYPIGSWTPESCYIKLQRLSDGWLVEYDGPQLRLERGTVWQHLQPVLSFTDGQIFET